MRTTFILDKTGKKVYLKMKFRFNVQIKKYMEVICAYSMVMLCHLFGNTVSLCQEERPLLVAPTESMQFEHRYYICDTFLSFLPLSVGDWGNHRNMFYYVTIMWFHLAPSDTL